MDPDFLHPDGHQGVDLSAITAHLPQQTHHKAHPESRGFSGPLERRAISCLDLPVHSSGRSLGC